MKFLFHTGDDLNSNMTQIVLHYAKQSKRFFFQKRDLLVMAYAIIIIVYKWGLNYTLNFNINIVLNHYFELTALESAFLSVRVRRISSGYNRKMFDTIPWLFELSIFMKSQKVLATSHQIYLLVWIEKIFDLAILKKNIRHIPNFCWRKLLSLCRFESFWLFVNISIIGVFKLQRKTCAELLYNGIGGGGIWGRLHLFCSQIPPHNTIGNHFDPVYLIWTLET